MATISGGERLEAALRKLSDKVSTPGTLRVGFLEGARYPNGTPVAMVAAIQEYGAPSRKIPPRPFFRNMIADKSPEWPSAIGANLVATNYDTGRTLDLAGAAIAGQLRESIIKMNSPPLSPVTLMLRMMKKNDPDLVVTGRTVGEAARRVAAGETASGVSTKVLVDTGFMLDRIDFEVKSS